MLSLSVNVFAAEPLTDDPNMIEWKYTVFADESLQKVVEEGVIPNAYARYTWRGITLKNGEVAILTPSNNSMGLYCNSGRYITINYTLSRSAFHRSRVRAYVAGPHQNLCVRLQQVVCVQDLRHRQQITITAW